MTNRDGNAFFILGACRRAMQTAGCTPEQMSEFQRAAMSSGSYNRMLSTCMEYFDVR